MSFSVLPTAEVPFLCVAWNAGASIYTTTNGLNWQLVIGSQGVTNQTPSVGSPGSFVAALPNVQGTLVFGDASTSKSVNVPAQTGYTSTRVCAWSKSIGLYCMVDGTYCLTSPDGQTWTQYASAYTPTGSPLRMLAGTSKFLTNNSSPIATLNVSSDGHTWASGGSAGFNIRDFSYDGSSVLVAVQQSGTGSAYSTNDGTSWTAGGALPSSNIWLVAHGNGRWVAASALGTGTAYCTTANPTAWTSGGALASISQLVFCNGLFFGFQTGTSNYYTSPDGIAWTTQVGPGGNFLGCLGVSTPQY